MLLLYICIKRFLEYLIYEKSFAKLVLYILHRHINRFTNIYYTLEHIG